MPRIKQGRQLRTAVSGLVTMVDTHRLDLVTQPQPKSKSRKQAKRKRYRQKRRLRRQLEKQQQYQTSATIKEELILIQQLQMLRINQEANPNQEPQILGIHQEPPPGTPGLYAYAMEHPHNRLFL
ncbi:hypothetical protein LOD99_15268 [Oopsacas minuta]|uniref:BZIP domain-containing protein n=1 Tax=Oopsacas minuta TaxID=111878 RepID=A0AAV7KBB4_9METZ|nr:hypothetical protein LOD99_15268 [Oopsacas minuta]